MKRIQFLLLSLVFSILTVKGQEVIVVDNVILTEKGYADTLQSLNLSGYGLTSIPENLNEFRALKRLDLSNNNIEILEGTEHLKNIEALILDNNPNLKVSGLNGSLAGLQNLKELSIAHSRLLFLPRSAYNLKGLEKLDVSNNEIELVSSEIKKLINLKELNLANNNIEFIDNGFQFLKKLQRLDLSSNPLLNREHLFIQLSQLNNLKELSIDHESINDVNLPTTAVESVEKLTLTNCNTTAGNSLVEAFPSLQVLSIEGSANVEGLGGILSKVKTDTLKQLTISNTEITELPNSIMRFRKLSKLHLMTNSLNSLPTSINRLTKLQDLSIRSEALNMTALTARLIPLKKLETLRIEAKEVPVLSKQFPEVKKLKTVEIITNSTQIENLDEVKKAMPNCEFIVNSVSSTKEKNGLNPPLTSVDVDFDQYLVNADKGAQIITPSGTQIIIPQKAFLDQEGEVVKGNVQVEYREFSDPIDMALAGVPMTEEENGETFTFSSAGMMQFRVKKKDEELKPNPDSLITINYNSPFEGDEYDLFYLDPEKEAWANIGKDSLIEPDSLPSDHTVVTVEETPPGRPIYPVYPYQKEQLRLCINDKEQRKTTLLYLHANSRRRRRDTSNKIFSELRHFTKVKWKVDYNAKDYKIGNDSIKTLISRINGFNRRSEGVPRRMGRSRYVWGQLRLINDYWIEPNKASDNFHLVLSLSGELHKIPIVPAKLPKRAENAQRKMKQIYTSFNKNLEKRRADWAKVDKNNEQAVIDYQNELDGFAEKMDEYRAAMGQFNRTELERLKTYAASESNIIRSFSLLNFGVFNCDIRMRMQNPQPLLAKLQNEEGKDLAIEKLYVLDKETNGLLTYSTQGRAMFESYHTNSIIAILKNNRVAVLKSTDFDAKPMNWRGTEVRLKTYDMNKVSIEELKRYGGFF